LPPQTIVKDEEMAKKLPLHQITTNRFQVPKGHEKPTTIAARQSPGPTLHAPQPYQPHTASSKISSYQESLSEEETHTTQHPSAPTTPDPTKKFEARESLDFELEILQNKSFTDLDAIPFTTDPTLPAPEPTLDATGTPIPFSTKLTNLNKMRHEDQTQFFRAQTDSEREETAAWFLEKFHSDMHKLMRARVERRKVALRFELEVKKRERAVRARKEDIDDELAGLKKGGGELIAGRNSVGK
jgi:hypothetical protein